MNDPKKAPDPPPGQARVLVWYQASRFASTRNAIIATVLVVCMVVAGRGIKVISDPKYLPVWAVFVATYLGVYFWFRRGRFSAGADWLAKRGRWVRTYELTEISYHSYPWGAGFYFRDSDGRTLRYLMWDLGSDRLLWDLTYNGIAHSVIAGGAKTNKQARNILRLPAPEDLG